MQCAVPTGMKRQTQCITGSVQAEQGAEQARATALSRQSELEPIEVLLHQRSARRLPETALQNQGHVRVPLLPAHSLQLRLTHACEHRRFVRLVAVLLQPVSMRLAEAKSRDQIVHIKRRKSLDCAVLCKNGVQRADVVPPQRYTAECFR
jgi:hypothetical protein